MARLIKRMIIFRFFTLTAPFSSLLLYGASDFSECSRAERNMLCSPGEVRDTERRELPGSPRFPEPPPALGKRMDRAHTRTRSGTSIRCRSRVAASITNKGENCGPGSDEL